MKRWTIGAFDEDIPIKHRRFVKRPPLMDEYMFVADGCMFRVPAKVDTDGESSPHAIVFLTGESFDWDNLGPALVHDAACAGRLEIQIAEGQWAPVYLSLDEANSLFRDFRCTWYPSWRMVAWVKWAAVSVSTRIKRSIHIGEAKWRKLHPDGVMLADVTTAARAANKVNLTMRSRP